MKKNIRGRVKRFLTSEVGQVGIRAPLALGVASGAVLLSQMVHTPSADAALVCISDADCGPNAKCDIWCAESSDGTCIEWASRCVPNSDS